jgi:hypothetical protein
MKYTGNTNPYNQTATMQNISDRRFSMEKTPKILILRWEAGHVPEGLMQLETMPGNSTNPLSYPFPVQMVHVKGANVQTVITHPARRYWKI